METVSPDSARERVRVVLHRGDNIASLARLPDASVDSVVTDPPYGISFMNKGWDAPWRGEVRSGESPMRLFQRWNERWAAESLRVLKPGGHMACFSSARTYHRAAAGAEDAGFEVRDQLMWLYGNGLPKSLDLSKAIDASLGARRTEVVGRYRPPGMDRPWNLSRATDRRSVGVFASSRNNLDVLAPATPEAAAWQGWRSALKPAHEPILLARKPPDGKGGLAANLLRHGTGALNVGACRIPGDVGNRFPSNVLHDGGEDVAVAFAAFPAAGGGDPSRFFYSAKATAEDREGSEHATVKPVSLMRWLCRLVTPPGGTVLDPFAGSGATGRAAAEEGFPAVLMEREEEHRADIARRFLGDPRVEFEDITPWP